MSIGIAFSGLFGSRQTVSDLFRRREPENRPPGTASSVGDVNFGWSRLGHRKGGHAGSLHADKLGRLGIGWPRLARNGMDTPGNFVRTNPKIQLQLDSLQGIASDGFVPPPAIEPNHDMWHPEKPVKFMSPPIRK